MMAFGGVTSQPGCQALGMKVGARHMNAVGLAVARVKRKCFGRPRAGAAPRSCPDAVACADFFHGSPLCRSLRRRGEPDAKRLRCLGRNELALPSLSCDPHRGSRHGACAPQLGCSSIAFSRVQAAARLKGRLAAARASVNRRSCPRKRSGGSSSVAGAATACQTH